MGLDMYAYVGTPNQYQDFYETGKYDDAIGEYVNDSVAQPRELAYWRKHPNLHGFFERLWQRKGRPGIPADTQRPMFNGIELELTWADLEELELAIRHGQLPATGGFFFGDPKDEFYLESDLAFIQKARAEIFLGLQVFYNSSW